MYRAFLVAALLGGTAAAHEYKAGSLKIDHPWTRAAQAGGNSVGYMMIANGGAMDTLLGATSSAATTVELHSVENDGGVMKMRPAKEGLAVPPKGALELSPAGNHLMLIGLKAPFEPGKMYPLTLKFAKAGEVKVELKVDDGKAKAAPSHDHH